MASLKLDEEAVERVHDLQWASVPMSRIAERLGIERSTLYQFLYGTARSSGITQRVMELSLDLTDWGLAPRIGAIRMIRAMVVEGWPMNTIRNLTGVSISSVNVGRSELMDLDQYRAVKETYDRIAGTPGPSAQAAKIGALRGWRSSAYWAGRDIDDERSGYDGTRRVVASSQQVARRRAVGRG